MMATSILFSMLTTPAAGVAPMWDVVPDTLRRLGGFVPAELSSIEEEPILEADLRRRAVFKGCDNKSSKYQCESNNACYWNGNSAYDGTCQPKSSLGCSQFGLDQCNNEVGVNNLRCYWNDYSKVCQQTAPTQNGCWMFTNEYQCSNGNDGLNEKPCAWDSNTWTCSVATAPTKAANCNAHTKPSTCERDWGNDNLTGKSCKWSSSGILGCFPISSGCDAYTSSNTCRLGSDEHGFPCAWSNGNCSVRKNVNCAQVKDQPTCAAISGCKWEPYYERLPCHGGACPQTTVLKHKCAQLQY